MRTALWVILNAFNGYVIIVNMLEHPVMAVTVPNYPGGAAHRECPGIIDAR